jgi:hypothetical protein
MIKRLAWAVRLKILTFAAIVEIGAGLVLLFDPAIVIKLLLGIEVSAEGTLLGRCFGIAVLALGTACWPGGHAPGGSSAAVRAMLLYNALIGLYLVYLGTAGRLGGLLLWPGVALHATLAFLLIWLGPYGRSSEETTD